MLRVLGYLKRNKKGQGLTEYVLILAFIAGVAFMMFGEEGSLKGTVVSTFDKTVELLAEINSSKSNYYAEHFGSYHQLKRDQLAGMSQEERVDMDLSALQNIANGLIGMSLQELIDTFPTKEANDEESKKVALGNKNYGFVLAQNVYDDTPYETNHQLGAIRDGDKYNDNTNPAILSLIHGQSYDNTAYRTGAFDNNGVWSTEGYFYSDGMIGNTGTSGKVTSYIRVKVTTDGSADNPKITGAHVWVTGTHDNNALLNSRQGSNGTTLAQGVTSGTMSQ